MLREIVRSQRNELTIKIPNEYLNKDLEVAEVFTFDKKLLKCLEK